MHMLRIEIRIEGDVMWLAAASNWSCDYADGWWFAKNITTCSVKPAAATFVKENKLNSIIISTLLYLNSWEKYNSTQVTPANVEEVVLLSHVQ